MHFPIVNAPPNKAEMQADFVTTEGGGGAGGGSTEAAVSEAFFR